MLLSKQALMPYATDGGYKKGNNQQQKNSATLRKKPLESP
jgi:hypothetical protein